MSGDVRISRRLSYWLRHAPEAAGLAVDGQGWAEVEAVLSALAREGLAAERADLERVVAGSDKNRFELSGDRIRARQGHSIAVEADWPRAEPPERLYHGTVARFLPSILEQGLLPGKRHHVHLSPDAETARMVGARRGQAVILEVAAGPLAATGAEFFLSANGVWLTAAVPPGFLRLAGEDH